MTIASTTRQTKLLCEYRPDAKGVIEYIRDNYSQTAKLIDETSHWMIYNGTVWEDRSKSGLDPIIIETLTTLYDDTCSQLDVLEESPPIDAKKKGILNRRMRAFDATPTKVKSYRDLTDQSMKASILDFDVGNLFNFSNGTLDMDTMEFRPHAPEDLLTRSVKWSYDAEATCPKFMEYLRTTIVKPVEGASEPGLPDGYVTDHETIDKLLEMLGYSLTTDTHHEIIIWLWGPQGGNGKTALNKILAALAGENCAAVDFNNMLNGKSEYYMADLRYARLATCNESRSTGTAPLDMLKQMGGGALVSAREPAGKPFRYPSYTTPIWAFNAFPRMTEAGGSVERRLSVIPFYRNFEEDPNKNPHLVDELMQELPGIFNLLMKGWQRLRANGKFTYSQHVEEVTQLQLNESCPVRQWLKECTIKSTTSIKGSELYKRYNGWMMSNANGRATSSDREFFGKLRQYGIVETTTGGVVNFKLEVTSEQVLLY